MANGIDSWKYRFRDAQVMVAFIVIVGGGVANYYIFRADLERADERSRVNAQLLQNLTSTFNEHQLRDATNTAAIKENDRQIRRLERSERRRDP